MCYNQSAPHVSSENADRGFIGYYALVPFVLLTLLVSVAALVVFIKKRMRLDELRHQLIPVYSYDPAEEDHRWVDGQRKIDEESKEPLYKEGQLH
ncbi:small integral membrane protein 29-like [Hippocampus zosterae]|uniref:small integral membrane protein 29-like n=1 Tax=Hippocampus zosterae TaxID=109293 RepID=UPI00223E8EA3|nr:small integral membrane protein 29-like [Hippocampus zosterae]